MALDEVKKRNAKDTKTECKRAQIAFQKEPNRIAIWALLEDERIPFGKRLVWMNVCEVMFTQS